MKATIYKETSDLNVFTRFCKGINEHRSIQFIPDSDLDNLLCQFFLAVCHGIEYKNNVIWYHAKPLGVNSIGQFMSKALTLLNLNVSVKIANHSCRKTSITNMLNSGIHPLFVTQISGHKKVESQ